MTKPAEILNFGLGEIVVGTGSYEQVPAIYLMPAPVKGEVGDKVDEDPFPDTLEGSTVLVLKNLKGTIALLEAVESAVADFGGELVNAAQVEDDDATFIESIADLLDSTVLATNPHVKRLKRIAQWHGRFERREKELLEANNRCLGRAREAEASLQELRQRNDRLTEILARNHDHHAAYDDTGGYVGSDLFNENTEALEDAK